MHIYFFPFSHQVSAFDQFGAKNKKNKLHLAKYKYKYSFQSSTYFASFAILTLFFLAPNVSFHFHKGQLISKCLYEIIIWTKIPTKFLKISALKGPGQKLSNFLLVFWSKRRLQKDILKLTDL